MDKISRGFDFAVGRTFINQLCQRTSALYTFIFQIGKSLYDEEGAKIVPEIMAAAKKNNVAIHLPNDFVCGSAFSNECNTCIATVKSGVPETYLVSCHGTALFETTLHI